MNDERKINDQSRYIEEVIMLKILFIKKKNKLYDLVRNLKMYQILAYLN